MLTQPPNHDRIWDLRIVGTGPVGVALARECEWLGREDPLLELGGSEIDPSQRMTSTRRLLTHNIMIQGKCDRLPPRGTYRVGLGRALRSLL